MRLQILGLNHTTAPVEIREQVVFAGENIGRALARLKEAAGINEVVLLSTCNRTEFYLMGGDAERGALQSWLHAEGNLDPAYATSLIALQNDDAIRHIFRVACGLDSMVLGEPQILGQLKDAVREAERAGTLGKHLGALFQHTFSVAKKVRTETEIGANPVSVASAAVTLAEQFFSGFAQHTALLVGAGVTVELVARHLTAKGLGRLFVANRDLNRARRLANQFGGYAVPLSELQGTLPEADILITSTASPDVLITMPQMEAAISLRRHKPVFALDIAVPRDIEAAVGELPDVYLYSIDDLDKVVLEGRGHREAAAIDAGRILEDEIRRYTDMARAREASPIITALREHGQSIRDEVTDQAQRRLAKGMDSKEVIEYATAAMMKKLLHNPSVRLRDAAENSNADIIAAARILFDLGEDSEQ
ncbi:MAG: glutamyl-tRNA reductase [Gammaproteobacteria bacterium]|nr:glutamyl-tRNA reductase [Gammaproteobacteria bacterium]MDH5305115.1 glutamyl-tRNA reductase [Gammaproteobacteria bacterium]MDH5323379.1 glutamyl-tRNA reductase [Gammaproteobacteria bacterium]